VISSTQIRKFITEGHIVEAVEMLGHPYLISVERVQGLKIGSQIGFPTLNFKRPSSQKVIPPPGVYAAELSFEDSILSGALYFVDCPTFSQREVHFEFHALELRGKTPEPGETGHIWVRHFIRKDRPFSDPGELAVQIELDVNKIRQYFSEEKLQWR
jgi:riboflavin kinase/FMN adenylyltransferase